MARRIRCKGECGELYPRDVLTEVGGVGLICDDCMDKVQHPEDPPPAAERETPEEKAARIQAIRDKHGLSTPEPGVSAALDDAADQPTLEQVVEEHGLVPASSLETPEAEIERVRIKEAKMLEHQRMVEAGEHPSESSKIAAKFTDSAKATGDIQPEQPEPTQTGDGQGLLGVPISVRDRVPPEADNRDWWRTKGEAEARPRDWPLKRARLSPTSVATLLRCPEQFRLKYVLGREERPNHNMIRGSAIHSAAEENWRYKIAHGDDMPAIDWETAYLDHFADRVSRAGGFGAVAWKGKPADLRDEAVPAVRAYAANIAPTVTPIATEEPFAIWVPGVPVPVCGIIDVVTTEGVLDTKFGKQRSKVIKPEWRIAAMLYARAKSANVVYHVGNWGGAFHTPADEPGLMLALTPEVHQIGGDVVRSAVQTIRALYAEFGAEQAWPHALIHQYACSGCAFRETHQCTWWDPKVETI